MTGKTDGRLQEYSAHCNKCSSQVAQVFHSPYLVGLAPEIGTFELAAPEQLSECSGTCERRIVYVTPMSSQTSIASTSRMPGEGSEVCEVIHLSRLRLEPGPSFTLSR